MRKKADLPRKVCAGCGLPFSWRKKWERDWDAVRYCSDRCRTGATVTRGNLNEAHPPKALAALRGRP